MHVVITVYYSHAYYIYAIHSSQTFLYGHLLHQIIYSNVDHDQTAFNIQKQGPSWPRILGRSDFSLQEN